MLGSGWFSPPPGKTQVVKGIQWHNSLGLKEFKDASCVEGLCNFCLLERCLKGGVEVRGLVL